MKRSNKVVKHRNIKNTINKIIVIIITFVIIATIAITTFNFCQNHFIRTRVVNSQELLKDEIKERENTINDLNKQIEELKNKQEEMLNKQNELEEKNNELKNEIEKVKISKINNKKTTVTSRSGSTIRDTNTTTNEGWIWANVSAYCACSKCCGKTNAITASGTYATAGRTIAAPSNYKFGTKIELEGMGTYVVEDRGGAITGNKIDVYFNSHSEALAFGRKRIRMKVVQ